MTRRSTERDREFAGYVETRRKTLLSTAYFCCGDWHTAEDLLQTALSKLYVSWPKVRRSGSEDAYVRRIIINSAIDASRRPWRREQAVEEISDRPAVETSDADDRSMLMAALSALPSRQRQVLVLRYWLDLSVADTARDLGIDAGTVKSQSAKGLERMRTLLADTYGIQMTAKGV